MAKKVTSKLSNRSRDILSFKPEIVFVEPDIIAAEPVDIVADIAATELDAALENRNKARSLANAVAKLAAATQIRVDQRAKPAIVALDPKQDALIIQAVRREFPEEDPTLITYEEYKICREKIAKLGEQIAQKALMTQDKVSAASNIPLHQIGGFGTPEAKDGRLRPETDESAQIIEPLDMDKFSQTAIKALMNILWKKLVRPQIVAATAGAGLILPKELFKGAEKEIGFPENLFAEKEAGNVKIQDQPFTSTEQIQKPSVSVKETKKPKKTVGVLELQDCQTIVKMFERGASFSQTEESVFALLTPHLQTMITQSRSTINQIDSYGVYTSKKDLKDKIADDLQRDTNNLTSPPRGKEQTQIDIENLVSSDKNSNPLFTDFVPVDQESGKREWNRIFDSKCIPCGLRISLSNQAFGSLAIADNPLFLNMIDWFLQQKRYIDDIIHFLKGIEPTDICQFIGILTDFVCVPDLARILSLLSSLLIKLSIKLHGQFDIILSLIAPLITPLISGLVSMIHQYVMMIVKPIECVIDSLVAMVKKLDYNIIFETAGNLNFKLDAELAAPVQGISLDIEGSAEFVARTKRSGTGAAASALEGTKPMLHELVGYLREIMDAITGFELKLSSELQKLMGQYLGGTGSSIGLNFKKLGIIQMMSLISMLIQLFRQKPNCSPQEAMEVVTSKMSNDAFTFYTDDQGNIHIDENQDNIDDVLDDVIIALGGQDGGTKVESTGDPLLDMEISKTVDALTTATSITFRCSLQTTTADATKVNEWVDELST